MKKLLYFLALCVGAALSAGWATYAGAAISPQGALDLGHYTGTGTTYSAPPYSANVASNLLVVLVQNGNGDNTTFGVTANGVAMTLACGSVTANSGGMIYFYYLLAPVGGVQNIVVKASAPVAMSVGAADYTGVGALESPCKVNPIGKTPATTTISTLTDGDFVILATGGYTAHSAGAGDVLRAKDGSTGYQQWGLFDSGGPLTVGSHSFTTSLALPNSINQLAMVFSPAPPPPPPPVVVPPPPPPPVSVSGTPFSFGWKGSNPDGQTLLTAPHNYTLGQVELHVTVPASGPALLDLYKVADGVPCTATTGTKLHTGDFNAAGAANMTQILPLIPGAASLAVNDNVCVVMKAPFTADGQATVTVTAQ